MSRLDKFVRSPYFNSQDQLTSLWAFYNKHHPDFSKTKFNDAEAYKQLFDKPAKKDNKRLNRLNSELYKLVEQFISVRELESDKFTADALLLDFFDREGLSEHSLSLHQRLRKQLAEHPQGEALFFNQLALEKAWWAFQAKRDKRTGDVNLQAYNEALDTHFLVQKLKLLALMINRRQVVHTDYELSWMENAIAHAQEEKYREVPTIQLYLYVLQLQLYPTEKKYYHGLKYLLKKWSGLFLQEELRTFFGYLTNAVKYHITPEDYTKELFNLYRQQLDLGILHHNQQLAHSTYRNVASVALDLGEFAWAESFIENNRHCIMPEAYSEDAYLLNMASLHYHQGQLDQAQLILAQLNPSDIYYKLVQRSLQCHLFYEQKELLLLSKFLASFAKYVHDQQDKIAASKITSYRHFINYLNALIKIIMDTESSWTAFSNDQPISNANLQEDLLRLQEKIEAEPLFYYKSGLLDKLIKLKGQ